MGVGDKEHVLTPLPLDRETEGPKAGLDGYGKSRPRTEIRSEDRPVAVPTELSWHCERLEKQFD